MSLWSSVYTYATWMGPLGENNGTCRGDVCMFDRKYASIEKGGAILVFQLHLIAVYVHEKLSVPLFSPVGGLGKRVRGFICQGILD